MDGGDKLFGEYVYEVGKVCSDYEKRFNCDTVGILRSFKELSYRKPGSASWLRNKSLLSVYLPIGSYLLKVRVHIPIVIDNYSISFLA